MSRHTLTRRRLVGLGGLSVLAVAGCSRGSDGAGSGGSGQLDVALWGDATRADLYQQTLDLYAESHSDVTTKLQFADLDPYLERLTTQAAAGELPDVLWMRDTHVGRYGSAGSLLDLSDYIGDTIDVSTLGEAAVSTGTVGDGVFALPTHYVGQALIHDVESFDDRGIDIDSITSWDDLAAAATELADQNAEFYGMADPTLGSTHRHLEAWIRQAGQEVFTPEGGVGFDAAVLEEWFAFWDELRSEGVIPPADAQVEADGGDWTTNLLVTNDSAIIAASTNHLTAVQPLTRRELAMSSIPELPDATEDWWFFPPILISGGANTEDPDAVAELLDFFLNDVKAGKITGTNQGAPSSSAVRDALLPDLDEQQTAFIDQISREQGYPSRPFPIRPEGSGQLNDAIGRAGQEIAYGRQSVTDAVAALMRDADRALST